MYMYIKDRFKCFISSQEYEISKNSMYDILYIYIYISQTNVIRHLILI